MNMGKRKDVIKHRRKKKPKKTTPPPVSRTKQYADARDEARADRAWRRRHRKVRKIRRRHGEEEGR